MTMLAALTTTACGVGDTNPASPATIEVHGPSPLPDSDRVAIPESAVSEASRNPAELMDEGAYRAEIKAGDFVSVVDNPYLPLTPGLTHVYQGRGELNEVTVTRETRQILGVTTVVVLDQVFVDGELVERSYDWYAQDRWGNVWLFGEAHADFEGGVIADTGGSWEAGVAGAMPGVAMLGAPRRGDVYRLEFHRGIAEDMTKVISLGQWSDVPYGSFSNVLVTEDWTPLEDGELERKSYAAGIGLIADEPDGAGAAMQLIQVRDS
jgi:hypothetical protein